MQPSSQDTRVAIRTAMFAGRSGKLWRTQLQSMSPWTVAVLIVAGFATFMLAHFLLLSSRLQHPVKCDRTSALYSESACPIADTLQPPSDPGAETSDSSALRASIRHDAPTRLRFTRPLIAEMQEAGKSAPVLNHVRSIEISGGAQGGMPPPKTAEFVILAGQRVLEFDIAVRLNTPQYVVADLQWDFADCAKVPPGTRVRIDYSLFDRTFSATFVPSRGFLVPDPALPAQNIAVGVASPGPVSSWLLSVRVHVQLPEGSPSDPLPFQLCLMDMHDYYLSSDVWQWEQSKPSSHPCDCSVRRVFVGSSATLAMLSVLPGNATHGEAVGENAVTLVTQLTSSRIPLIAELAGAWTGPVVVVAYYDPSEYSLEEFQNLMQSTLSVAAGHQASMGVSGRGSSDLTVVLVEGCPREAYPINVLRNIGIQTRKTEFYFASDADFIPSVDAHDQIQRQLSRHFPVTRLSALVVPCFGYKAERTELPVLRSKVAIKTGMVEGTVIHGSPNYSPSHDPTNVKMWMLPLTEVSQVYEAVYAESYEPYVVCNSECPLYPEEFRGWGMDKVSLIFRMHTMGWRFFVDPGSFIFHKPHDRLADWTTKSIYFHFAWKRYIHFTACVRQEVESLPARRSSNSGSRSQ